MSDSFRQQTSLMALRRIKQGSAENAQSFFMQVIHLVYQAFPNDQCLQKTVALATFQEGLKPCLRQEGNFFTLDNALQRVLAIEDNHRRRQSYRRMRPRINNRTSCFNYGGYEPSAARVDPIDNSIGSPGSLSPRGRNKKSIGAIRVRRGLNTFR